MDDEYIASVKSRSLGHFILGLVPRIWVYCKYALARWIARNNGARIGKGVMLPFALAKKANHNLTIGEYSIIGTSKIDLRCKVTIGRHVIITSPTCTIITMSHNINDPKWSLKYGGIDIEDYVWIPTEVIVLPSCRKIGYGAVIGSGSVVAKNVMSMSVVGGNPAIEINKRECIHDQVMTERLQTADLISYWRAYWL